MIRHFPTALVLAAFTWGSVASAQTARHPVAGSPGHGHAGARCPPRNPDDSVLNRSQPDFTLINLPTGLRLPQWKSAFRVTHRFTRPLGEGDFGNLAADFFGLDSGAVIGLEFRMGIVPGRPGRLLPHQRSDDPAVRAVRPEAAVGLVPAGAGRVFLDRRHQQLQGQLLAGGRPDRHARVQGARRASTSSRSG